MPRPRLVTPEQIDSIVARYQQGEGSSLLGKEFGITDGFVLHLVRERGCTVRPRKWDEMSPSQEREVLLQYLSIKSSMKVAEMFGISHHRVLNIVRRAGYGTQPQYLTNRPRTYTCDDRYFNDIIDEARAYWLGFMAADGNVCRIRGRWIVSFGLASKDEDHVVRFRTALKSDYPIVRAVNQRFLKNPSSRIAFGSDQMASDLMRHGVTPRKSATLKWPTLPADLYRHWLRGLSDGDGSFSLRLHSRTLPCPRWSLAGSLICLEGVQSYLKKTLDLNPVQLNKQTQTFGVICYDSRYRSRRLCEHLYTDATIWLPRKRDIVAQGFPDLADTLP